MTGPRPTGRFWWYLTGQALSMFGSSFTAFAVPLLVFRITGSPSGLAFALAASFAPYLLFGLVIGALTDRWDRRRTMIATDLVRAAVLLAVPLVAEVGDLHVWMLYAVTFAVTTMRIFFDAGAFAAVPHLVEPDGLVRANGLLQAAFSASRLVGPLLAGVAVGVLPLVWVLAVDAATFLLSAASLAIIRVSFNDAPAEDAAPRPAGGRRLGQVARDVRRDVAAGLRYVWSHPVLRSIAVLMSLVNFLDATVLAQLVLLAEDSLGASETQVAWLFGAANAGMLLLSLLAGRLRDRWSFSAVALSAQLGCGVCVLALGLVGRYWAGLVLWAAYSGLGVLFNINTTSLRQRIVPDDMLGRVMSISAVLAWSSVPLGALAGGAVVQAVGDIGLVYALIGAVTIALTLAFVPSPLGHAEDYLTPEKAGDRPG